MKYMGSFHVNRIKVNKYRMKNHLILFMLYVSFIFYYSKAKTWVLFLPNCLLSSCLLALA